MADVVIALASASLVGEGALERFDRARHMQYRPAPTITTTATPAAIATIRMMPRSSEEEDWGAGGGGTAATTWGAETMASTETETPVTLASMLFALLVVLVDLAIVDCTADAVAVGTTMLCFGVNLDAAMEYSIICNHS